MPAEVKLTRGLVALVDVEDLDRVLAFQWSATKASGQHHREWYARAVMGQRRVYLHRWLLDAPDSLNVDHINGSGLDCQRANLRVATASENQHNRRRGKNNTSGYKGVSLQASTGRYKAQIRLNGQLHYLGLYPTPELAYDVYVKAAERMFGSFANGG